MQYNNKTTEIAPHQQQRAAVLAQAEVSRAVAEAQSALTIAKQFPRDERTAIERIMQAFTRPALAEKAMYTYARGGSDITGPSIRAAEVLAQNWGNLHVGVRELEQRQGESTVEAFAWDVETNTRDVKVFTVPHVRETKKGRVLLTDARDIYEHIANQGSRRKRACILAVIPGDVVESAMHQAEMTLRSKLEITPETIKSLREKFESIKVSREMLEAYIQRRLDSITPALVVRLGKVYNSISDGMSVVADWFDMEESPAQTNGNGKKEESRTDSLLAKMQGATKPPEETAQDAEPVKSEEKPAQESAPVNTLLSVDVLMRKAKRKGVVDKEAFKALVVQAAGSPKLTQDAMPKVLAAINALPLPMITDEELEPFSRGLPLVDAHALALAANKCGMDAKELGALILERTGKDVVTSDTYKDVLGELDARVASQ